VAFADRTTPLPIGCVKCAKTATRETLDFIVPTPWLANSLDFSPVDYRIWGEAAGACVPQPDS